MAVLALAVFAGPAQAAPVGELGILDVSGTNPATSATWALGDTYRLAFITSTDTGTIGSDGNAMTDITEFNAHMQGLADDASLGGTWKVIGSTSLVDARDNTSTNPTVEVGCPILLLDGTTIVADNNADLWDHSVQHIINQTETGATKSHWPHTGTYWDGTNAAGKPSSGGGPLDSTGNIAQGNGSSTDEWIWRMWTARPPTEELPMYAMSDTLTVIPEPATMSLLVLGGLALLRRRRNRA